MPSVIDSLIVELSLDPRKFTDGQKAAIKALKDFERAADKARRQAESSSETLTNFFANAKRQAIGLVAAFFGARGITDFIVNMTGVNAEVGRTAKALNVATDALDSWRGVAQQTGTSAEEMTASLVAVNDQLKVFQASGQMPGKLLNVLNLLEINPRDAAGNFKEVGNLFLEIGEKSKGRSAAQLAELRTYLQIAGVSNNVINTLLIPNLRKLYDEQARLGNITKEAAEKSSELMLEFYQTSKAATAFGNSLLTEVGGPLTFVLNLLKEVFIYLRGARDKFGVVASIIQNPLTGLTHLGASYLASKIRDPLEGAKAEVAEKLIKREGTPEPTNYPLQIKPGAGTPTPTTSRIMSAISSISGIDRVTALKDDYHKGFKSAHNEGLALDLTVKDPKRAAEVAASIQQLLNQLGIKATVKDEYSKPSGHSTAPHIHIGAAAVAAAKSSGAVGGKGDRTSNNTVQVDTINVYGAKDAETAGRKIAPQLMRVATLIGAEGGRT